MASDFWDAIENLLDERANGVGSRRALAARLYELDQRQTQDSWLRSLKRYAAGSIPTEETATLIARAFAIPRDALPAVERLSLQSLDFRTRLVEAKGAAMEEVYGNRLLELAEKLSVTETALANLKDRHRRLQSRVRSLEAAPHAPGVTATKGRTPR